MKSSIAILICSSLLLESCYSFFPLTERQVDVLLSDPKETVQITLTNGTEIIAKPYHYVGVNEPSDFVIGVGELWNVRRNSKSPFHGKLQPQKVDSGWMTRYQPGRQGWEKVPMRFWDYWTSESTKVRFKKDEFIVITTDQGMGLYVNWYVESGFGIFQRRGSYRGKIPLDQIHKIEQKRLSEVKTLLLEAGVVACVAGGIYLYRFFRGLGELR